MISALIDLVEECAFQFGAYGTEVLSALDAVRALWAAGHSSASRQISLEAFSTLIHEHLGGLQGEEAVSSSLEIPFCYELERSLAQACASPGIAMPPGGALSEVIAQYEKMTRPKAFALLESLARQADLEYSKRHKEGLMLKLSDLAASGVPLPREASDIAGFSAPRFRRLAAQIPRGQSILDFYILNRIRHRLSRAATAVYSPLRDGGIPRNIHFGTLELSRPGAEIVPVEGAEEYLIILSRALWTATSLATAIITRCVKLDQSLPAPVGFDKGAAADLAASLQMLDRILLCQELDFEFPTVADERHKVFWELLDSATKSFIFGHEYAHMLARHLEQPGPLDTAHLWNQELFADVLAIQVISKDQESAINKVMQVVPPPAEADLKQVEAAQQAMSDLGLFHTASGAALVLYLFWRMEALHGRSATRSDSHPPVPIRLGNIWTFLRLSSLGFDKVFRFANLMLRDFISLLPPIEGSWRDQFQEAAFRPLMLNSYDNVIDMIDKVNTGEALLDPSLETARARLEALFQDPGTPYEEKYPVLEECVEMVRMSRQADPLGSIKDAVQKK